jgi:hypothetical protein
VKLEQVQKGVVVRGLAVEGMATVKSVEFHGSNAMEVIFTDGKRALHNRIVTLLYLSRRIRTRLGKLEAVEEIHGAVARDKRKTVVERFMNDPTLLVLVANDGGLRVSRTPGGSQGRSSSICQRCRRPRSR